MKQSNYEGFLQIDIWLWGLYTWYLLETEPTLQFFLLPSKISKTLSKHEDWVKTVSCLFFWCLMNHQNMKIILLPAYYIPTLSLLPHSSLPSEGPQTWKTNWGFDLWLCAWHLIIELPRILNILQLFAELFSTEGVAKPESAVQLRGGGTELQTYYSTTMQWLI